jgi:hypothetical protein
MQWNLVSPRRISTKAGRARMYDAYLGGKENYEVDRVAAEKL